jgi:CxxC motif-containing protein (DUF1111 family)
MRDGASLSRSDAIGRHNNQAARARRNFEALSRSQRSDLIDFLNSL